MDEAFVDGERLLQALRRSRSEAGVEAGEGFEAEVNQLLLAQILSELKDINAALDFLTTKANAL